jgi:hypothetical protein
VYSLYCMLTEIQRRYWGRGALRSVTCGPSEIAAAGGGNQGRAGPRGAPPARWAPLSPNLRGCNLAKCSTCCDDLRVPPISIGGLGLQSWLQHWRSAGSTFSFRPDELK